MSSIRLPRPLSLLATTTLAAVVLAACGSSAGPGWTYAPAPSATPAASGGASGSPSASSPVASQPAPSASPVTSGGTATVTIVATTPLAFDTPAVTAPADEPFELVFDNQDATAQHNVVINNPDGTPVSMGDTAFFMGPEQRTYQVPALAAGSYPFLCQVHPTAMTGTLTVE